MNIKMSELGSTTVYIPENVKPSRASSYAAFLNENNFNLLTSQKQENPTLLRGPRRVFRLCLFALILPTFLITIPLYVRLVLYPPGHYPMMPTDQRVLSRHVSSFWCQGQSTRMNGSFTTYQAQEAPPLKKDLERHVMLHSLVLRDDIKEYWGFHLLKGSKVTISTCSSQEGAQLMILRGIENLKRCAWIGQEDSTEEIEGGGGEGGGGGTAAAGAANEDEKKKPVLKIVTSTFPPAIMEEKEEEEEDIRKNEPVQPNIVEIDKGQNASDFVSYEDASEERRQQLQDLLRRAMKMSKGKKEILRILHSVGRGGTRPLPKNIRQMMGIASGETFDSTETQKFPLVKKNLSASTAAAITPNNTSLLSRARRSILIDYEESDDDKDGAFEEYDDEDDTGDGQLGRHNKRDHDIISPYLGQVFYPEGLKFERGKFNQTDRADKSNEEDYSSYSSSEEALASCDGVIMALPLESYRSCSYRWTEINKISYDIPVTGTYYFVYSSENEIFSNTIYLNMTLEKVVYDVNSSQIVCSNSTDCLVPITFWSNDQVVVEVPEEGSWDHSYVLDTTCDPRVAVYLTFLLLVPILILFCAFQ